MRLVGHSYCGAVISGCRGQARPMGSGWSMSPRSPSTNASPSLLSSPSSATHRRCSDRANHQDQVTPFHLPGLNPGCGPPPGREFQQWIDMREPPGALHNQPPTPGRSSVSTQQRERLEAVLRQSGFPADIDLNEQRRLLRELISAQPLPADVTVTAAALGGVPTAEITVDGIEPRHVVLYFHGGVYVLGDAFGAADVASQVGRRTRAKAISVDYRLAPEHPYPAAVDDALAAYEALLHNGTAPSDIAFAGESAGGGLAIATLVNARDHGLPLPVAAFVMSPYADLTLAGATMETKREADPLLSPQALHARVTDYTSGQDAALGLISPIFAELSGLPPLIIQAGTHEVLLDDAIRLARVAATADVEVTLDITPGCPTSSRPITRSSTKRPRHWTEPDSSCRRISPAQNASPPSETQNARCPHSPQAAGSNPVPATRKYQIQGLIAGNGRRAFHHPVPADAPGS